MISITSVVKKIVLESDFATHGMQTGALNLRQYAAQIQEQVEEQAKKPASINSIAMALSRVQKEVEALPPVKIDLVVHRMSTQTNLVEIVYDQSSYVQKRLQKVQEWSIKNNHFFTVVQGFQEIAFIVDSSHADAVKDLFSDAEPVITIPDLVAVTLSVPKESIETPNQIYTMLCMLAPQQISVVDIISTYTEVTLLIENKNLSAVQSIFQTLQ